MDTTRSLKSSFTPINRRATAPHLKSSIDLVDVPNIPSNIRSQSSTRNKKRVSSQTHTSSTVTKKLRRTCQKKAEKPASNVGSGSLQISNTFPQQQYTASTTRSYHEDTKSTTQRVHEIVPLQTSSLNVGMTLSAETMGKLAAFRYQHGPPKCMNKTEYANQSNQLRFPGQLERHELGITKSEDDEGKLHVRNHQDISWKDSGSSKMPTPLTEPRRLHEVTYGSILPSPLSLLAEEVSPFSCHISDRNNSMLETRWERDRGIHCEMYDAPTLENYSPRKMSPTFGFFDEAAVGNSSLDDEDLFTFHTHEGEGEGASGNFGPHYGHSIKVGRNCHNHPSSSPNPQHTMGVVTCTEDPGLSADEFPMDENDMEDDLYLPTVQESFEPPPSLEFPFDDNSQTNEVYDPRLQFSEPSSRRNIHTIYRDGVMDPIEGQTTFDAVSSHFFRSSSYNLAPISHVNGDASTSFLHSSSIEDENFLSDEDEQDLLKLSAQECQAQSPKSLVLDMQAPASPKLKWNVPTHYKPTRLTSQTPAESPTIKSSLSSIEVSSFSHALQPLTTTNRRFKPIPFARPAFPIAVRDRSPIVGLSRAPFLRLCFRIGEALNAGCAGARHNIDIVIELYARVTYSERDSDGIKQHFQFADLFTSERPPFLNGSYNVWKGVELWDHDSKAFLGAEGIGNIARIVGKIKRDEKNKSWKLMILSIWKATWDDVNYAKGVICA